MATNYPADWDSKYTDPALRARLKDEVVAGDKGGKPGQWSARKAQLLKAEYEKAGGGYLGEKDATQQHLSEWTEEDWQTSDGSARARTGSEDERGGASKRYLPKEAWDHLSEEEKRATDARKAEGSAHGEQFVPNTDAAEEAGREARHHHGDDHGDDSGAAADLPIEGYDELSAKDAAKAVGRLEDADQVRAVRDFEQAHGDRKTVLDRAERALE
jgi:hypothetical protein